jgi:major membrane immunogen (membrane-anchored lipoprotein)
MTLAGSGSSIVICLLLLTGCAASTVPSSQSGCPDGTIRIENEDTGNYDCVSQLEYEQIIRDLDEERW